MIYCKLDKLLKKNGKTKYWLVNQLESDYQTVNNLMNNKTSSIRFSTLEKLCKIFNCTLDDIFEVKY